MDLKMSLCNAGKPTRMRHKHSIRRDDGTCVFTREKLIGRRWIWYLFLKKFECWRNRIWDT